MALSRDQLRDMGLDEIKINAQEARGITLDTINGRDDDYKELNEGTKNNLLSHGREDIAWAALNTALIYRLIQSNIKKERFCRIIIIIILLYIAYKVS